MVLNAVPADVVEEVIADVIDDFAGGLRLRTRCFRFDEDAEVTDGW